MTPERKNRITTVLNNRQPDLTVIIENVEDPHNIFAVMRTCDAVGIQEIYVINTVFKKHRKFGRKSSSSAAKWLDAHFFDNVADCMQAVRKKYNKVYCAYLSDKAESMYDLDLKDSVALVFGNEKEGISDELRQLSDGDFLIPQVGMILSLNISVACAVTIYEAYRQRNEAGYYSGEPRMNTDDWKRLEARWAENKKRKPQQ